MNTYTYGNDDALNIMIQMVDDHDLSVIGQEVEHIRRLTSADFTLIAVKVDSWNNDLSPWEAPPVFGDEGFGNGAGQTLEYIKTQIVPELSSRMKDPECRMLIGGYSLAGLFALWSVYQTDIFSGAAAASPSAWFPGFTDYVRENEILTPAVYLSLGDKEEKTRNPVMAGVGNAIREISGILDSNGTSSILEWNQGNHFRDPDLRMAKGFAWLLNRI